MMSIQISQPSARQVSRFSRLRLRRRTPVSAEVVSAASSVEGSEFDVITSERIMVYHSSPDIYQQARQGLPSIKFQLLSTALTQIGASRSTGGSTISRAGRLACSTHFCYFCQNQVILTPALFRLCPLCLIHYPSLCKLCQPGFIHRRALVSFGAQPIYIPELSGDFPFVIVVHICSLILS